MFSVVSVCQSVHSGELPDLFKCVRLGPPPHWPCPLTHSNLSTCGSYIYYSVFRTQIFLVSELYHCHQR